MNKLKNTKKSAAFDRSSLIINLFREFPNNKFSLKHLASASGGATKEGRLRTREIITELLAQGTIEECGQEKYRLSGKERPRQEGIVQMISTGAMYIRSEEFENDVYVSQRNSLNALDGDRVEFVITRRSHAGSLEGEITRIVERSRKQYVGTADVSDHAIFVKMDPRRMPMDVYLSKRDNPNVQHGDKVVIRITDWALGSKSPAGELVEVLGRAGENNTEMHAILAEFGLPYVYPAAVEKVADKIPAEISAEEIARREDFRGVTTFTIDPKDAKDFDDALSIRKLKGGLWEVGVHIADVTHYVKEGGIIDKEAEKRATSVYLVDRTIPMLPERLCNFICSLRPDEEKLAYSVIFEMTEKGEVKNSRVVHTVIKSDRRFTYEEAQEIIETGKGDFQEEVLQLDKLAKILRENRFKAGAINFDRYEVKFEIDEKGKPVSVYFKESKDANKLIEEFMLLANRTVAEKIGRVPKGKKAKVLPYRIHDLPDPEKLDNLAQFIARFGYKLRTSGTKTDISKSINHLLDDIQGKKEENLIETVSIRAMQKARYSVHNVGHYGLAFDYYTHFTSPIRRYPDMMVHRLLTKYLDQGGRTVSEQKYEALCEHSSSMEQIASNAERASIKYKQVEFMSDKLGENFMGTISGVTQWGFYVELNDTKCEGLVAINELEGDYYEFDEENYCIVGRHHRKVYQLGDQVLVKVVKANLVARQLDFALVESTSTTTAAPAKVVPPKASGHRQRPERKLRRGRRGNAPTRRKEKKRKSH